MDRFTLYALNSRSHGRSRKSKQMGYGLMTADTAEMIRALEIERPVPLGSSDGGIIALMLGLYRSKNAFGADRLRGQHAPGRHEGLAYDPVWPISSCAIPNCA